MQFHQIKDSKNRPIANLYFYLDYSINQKRGFIESIIKDITYNPFIGFAGFKNKQILKKHLEWNVFGPNQNKKIEKISLSTEGIKSVIEDSVKKCLSKVNSKTLEIFVFPTFSLFVKEKMNGCAGYCFWNNTILIYINNQKNWEKTLGETICHEFSHSVALNYNKRETLLDNIAFEGLAQHFSEYMIKDNLLKFKSLTKKESMGIFKNIKYKLNSKNFKLNQDVFFGTGQYPLWAGYSIGYYLVSDFLKKYKKINWNEIHKIPPKEILKESNF